mgnify:CR=1 FL=1
MKKIVLLSVVVLLGFYSSTVQAGLSASIALGWPLMLTEEDWDSCSGSTRLGLSNSWLVGDVWSWGITGGVKIPFNSPHFIPRIGINVGFKVNDWFGFGGGLLYELIPPYGPGEINHFLGLGICPTILTKSGVRLSLVTGPGMLFHPQKGPLAYTWVIQPMLSFPFP